MGFDNTVTVVGNITRDPELRFTQAGMPIATFAVAWNRRRQDQDDEVSFFDITCFRSLAENVAESLHKGSRVVVYGTLQQRSWETPDGNRRSKVEILADDVAPSLRFASAEITRNEFRGERGGQRGGGNSGSSGGSRGFKPQSEPRRPATEESIDEEPF